MEKTIAAETGDKITRRTTHMLKFIKMLTGLALLPFCWAVSVAVYPLLQASIKMSASGGWEAWALPIGFFIWVLLFFLLPRPMRTYVLGHELTHALWALLLGGRVGKMKVGKSGGHVEVSKTNFIVTLAPYIFPFYTFLVIAAYSLAGLVTPIEPYRVWWLGAVGFTWSFHLTFTIQTLLQNQSDVQKHGKIFSYVVIYTANLLVMSLWIILIGPPRLAPFGMRLKTETIEAYQACWIRAK